MSNFRFTSVTVRLSAPTGQRTVYSLLGGHSIVCFTNNCCMGNVKEVLTITRGYSKAFFHVMLFNPTQNPHEPPDSAFGETMT